MHRFAIVVWLAGLVGGCQIKTALHTGIGSGGSAPKDDRAVASGPDTTSTMPDLHGLTRDDAMAALARAGIEPRSVDTDPDIACDDDQTQHGRVCHQSPVPGAQTLSHAPVELEFQDADPDSHTPGVAGAHYAMPDVRGLSLADARTKLAAAGFSAKDHFVVDADETCGKPGVVCGQEPDPGAPTTTEVHKLLHVGFTKDLDFDGSDLFGR
jgi:beta-lactam-binding protein with PASTA domain